MATSRFENLRAALDTQITSQLSTDGVSDVTIWRYPRGTSDREDLIVIGNIRGTQEPYTQGASGTRAEEIEIDLMVRCPQYGDSEAEYAAAEQRAESVMASIENTVRNDETINSTVFNAEFAEYETNHTFDGEGAVGVIEITITAEAHL